MCVCVCVCVFCVCVLCELLVTRQFFFFFPLSVYNVNNGGPHGRLACILLLNV